MIRQVGHGSNTFRPSRRFGLFIAGRSIWCTDFIFSCLPSYSPFTPSAWHLDSRVTVCENGTHLKAKKKKEKLRLIINKIILRVIIKMASVNACSHIWYLLPLKYYLYLFFFFMKRVSQANEIGVSCWSVRERERIHICDYLQQK